MKSDFINNSGYYDPVAAEIIKLENEKENSIRRRNKEIHETIKEIKTILFNRDLELINRIELKDLLTLKIYK